MYMFMYVLMRSSLWVSTSDFQPEAQWFKPGLSSFCHVVSFDKKLHYMLSTLIQMYSINEYQRQNARGGGGGGGGTRERSSTLSRWQLEPL